MPKYDEISSTEKLLDLIRDKDRKKYKSINIETHRGSGEWIKMHLTTPFSIKKAVTIGVDIGHDNIKLAKIRYSSSHHPELIDYKDIPFETGIKPDHINFVPFLKSSLTPFCGTTKNFEIWANISSARVEMRYLKIPKVPRKQIANAVYWAHRKIAPFDYKATTFDFEVLGETNEHGTLKTEIMSFAVPKHEIEVLRRTFSKAAYQLTGISIVPFAFQNLLRTSWIEAAAKNISSLYIGRDWSRIDIFSKGNLVLSRGIKAGIKTMKESMQGKLNGRQYEYSDQIRNIVDIEKMDTPVNQNHIKTDEAQQIFFNLIHDTSSSPLENTELDPKEAEIFMLILPALERLVRQIERTFEHYSQNFDNERVEKIYISSEIRPHKRIVDYITDESGLDCETFDPFMTNPDFLKKISIPKAAGIKSSYAPAMGMALSNNSITPNFLYTHKEKMKYARSVLIDRITVACFVAMMSFCIGYFLFLGHNVDKKYREIANLEHQLEGFDTIVNQEIILKLVDQAKLKNEAYGKYSKKYLGIAVLSEISNLTPVNIRLLSITAALGKKMKNTDGKGGKTRKDEKFLLFEGIISGEQTSLEASLAGYLISLRSSLLFEQPVIKKKSFGFLNNEAVLQFTAQLKFTES